MDIKYQVYGDNWLKCVGSVDKEDIVELPLIDVSERVARTAKVRLFSTQVKDSVPIEMLANWGQPYDGGKYFVTVVEFLPEEED